MLDAREIAAFGMSQGAAQKPSEFVQLVDLVLREQPKVVLEIGTMQGGTLAAWCAAADPQALIVSVDLPGGEWGGGYHLREVPRLEGYAQPAQRLVLIRGDSHQPDTFHHVKQILHGHPVDFLFIDGDHSYEGVRQDFLDYCGFVRPGGLIAFHDILPHPQVPGCQVDRLWSEEIRGRFAEEWEFAVDGEERTWGPWGGIGVIRWPGAVPGQEPQQWEER